MDPFVSDLKQYNSLRRRLKKQSSFPCNISGFIFQNENELKTFQNELSSKRRQANREAKAKQIRETKLDLNELEEMNESDTIEENGAAYSTKNPIGIRSNDKLYRIPKTNRKDREQTFEEIKSNQELLTDLLQTDDADSFKSKTMNGLKDPKLRKRMNQHMKNDLVRDNTWNRNEFLKLMERLMNDNQNLQEKVKMIENDRPKQRSRSIIETEIDRSFNPKLFEKKY